MIPNHSLSNPALPATFLVGNVEEANDLVDFEEGGVALNDSSEGLQVQVWRIEIVGGSEFIISAPNTMATTLFSAAGSTEVSLAFDQNMRPAVAFVQDGVAKFRFFDALVGAQVIREYPGAVNPRCTLDDKRPSQSAASDIILAYTISGALYYREQRDRFNVEYLLSPTTPGKLVKVGMSTGNRLQFEFYGAPNENNPTELKIGQNTVSLPVKKLNDEQFADITLRGVRTTIPQYFFDNGNYPMRGINLWPIPKDAKYVELWMWQPLLTFDSIDEEINLPDGYERAIKFNLALELAPEFMKSVPGIVSNTAATSLMEIQRLNQEHPIRLSSARNRFGNGVYGFNYITGINGTPDDWWQV